MKRSERERLTELLGPRIDARFCPHRPHPKQLLVLQLDEAREVFYGGAAGGGKSDLILMAFLQYADQPHYRGLILRRNGIDLEKSGSILDRAKKWWLRPGTGIRYEASKKKFIFPSGATCEFGHAKNVGDEVRQYQGGSWHFIAFDELGQFAPQQYLYLFSRLRRDLELDSGLPLIPLRMRAAGNPGGISHNFNRDRFMSLEYAKAILTKTHEAMFIREVQYEDEETGELVKTLRVFVPALLSDNPSLDAVQYRASLRELDVVTREQLMRGDWVVSASGRFKPEWFEKRYRSPLYDPSAGGWYRIMNRDGSNWKVFHERDCYRFITIDPAGTEADETAAAKGKKQPSWSVISTWDMTNEYGFLFWRHLRRLQGEFPDVVKAIIEVFNEQHAQAIFIETDGIGKMYYQHLESLRLPVVAVDSGGKDKLVRSASATHEAAEGRAFLPEYAPWLSNLEAELFTWQGHKGEVADQIDTFSHAAQLKVDGRLLGDIVIDMSAGRA